MILLQAVKYLLDWRKLAFLSLLITSILYVKVQKLIDEEINKQVTSNLEMKQEIRLMTQRSFNLVDSIFQDVASLKEEVRRALNNEKKYAVTSKKIKASSLKVGDAPIEITTSKAHKDIEKLDTAQAKEGGRELSEACKFPKMKSSFYIVAARVPDCFVAKRYFKELIAEQILKGKLHILQDSSKFYYVIAFEFKNKTSALEKYNWLMSEYPMVRWNVWN